MGTITIIIICLGALILGAALSWLVSEKLLGQKTRAVLSEAEREAEVLKQKKLLEVKEKFLQLKGDLEQQVAQRNNKLKQIEGRLKTREQELTQRHNEVEKRNQEIDTTSRKPSTKRRRPSSSSFVRASRSVSRPSEGSPLTRRANDSSRACVLKPRTKPKAISTRSSKRRR